MYIDMVFITLISGSLFLYFMILSYIISWHVHSLAELKLTLPTTGLLTGGFNQRA